MIFWKLFQPWSWRKHASDPKYVFLQKNTNSEMERKFVTLSKNPIEMIPTKTRMDKVIEFTLRLSVLNQSISVKVLIWNEFSFYSVLQVWKNFHLKAFPFLFSLKGFDSLVLSEKVHQKLSNFGQKGSQSLDVSE